MKSTATGLEDGAIGVDNESPTENDERSSPAAEHVPVPNTESTTNKNDSVGPVNNAAAENPPSISNGTARSWFNNRNSISGAYYIFGPGYGRAREASRERGDRAAVAAEDDGEGNRPVAPHIVPEAYLVEEGINNGDSAQNSGVAVEEGNGGEVVEARPLSFLERKWRAFAGAMVLFIIFVMLAVTLPLILRKDAPNGEESAGEPSTAPSPSPTFDPRPTLEQVQERGYVICGLGSAAIMGLSQYSYVVDICRAVAAVLLGNPDSYENSMVTWADRFQKLEERSIDILLYGDTHTVEREVMERTTGVGFTFSAPYYYDGMAYYGAQPFVKCAENKMRSGECSSLHICTSNGSTSHYYVKVNFPDDFFTVTFLDEERVQLMSNGTCNVMAADRSHLLHVASTADAAHSKFVVGDKAMTKDPLAIVTRKNDRQFSDAINWIVQALYYGEEQGLTKDDSLCKRQAGLTSHAGRLNFLNAVYCVGNYGEVVFKNDADDNRGMNRINGGDTGMLYAIPFGNLDGGNSADPSFVSTASTLLDDAKQAGSLNCGVIVPDGLEGANITTIGEVVEMGADYCRALAGALFQDSFDAINIVTFSDVGGSSAFAALDNGDIDVLAGVKIHRQYDFQSPLHEGFQFSTPYYYGNESASSDVSFYSLATREDDALFSSFVNCIVLATIYAQEKGINKERSEEMPLIKVFPQSWALRDAVSYTGSYDELYTKHFGAVSDEHRGRNTLNDGGGPQIHSFPGLAHDDTLSFLVLLP